MFKDVFVKIIRTNIFLTSARLVSAYSPSPPSPSSPSTRSHSSVPLAKPLGEFRRLNEKELQSKREKGECFRYDKKWVMGHRCKRLSVILMQGEDEVGDEGGTSEEDVGGEECGDEGKEVMQSGISLNSVVGISNPKTLKLVGKINGTQVVVMVDPSVTHNFISTKTVQKLEIPVVTTGKFEVSLGNGETVEGKGVCRAVVLQLLTITIIEDFLPLTLGNSDLILGVQWLEKLGTVATNH